jgi:N-acylneuraminate cytidylyltransferase
MRVLGVVPARGGSKGIPGKNVAPLAGRPLLAWTADAALRARRLTRVVLSTDDAGIAEVGRALGLDVPFLRPGSLAQDDTPTLPVLLHALDALPEPYDAVFILQPTNPLRRAADIDGAVDLLYRTGADSVIGFTDAGERHPARMKALDADGRVQNPPFAEAFEGQRRQDLPRYWLRDGSVYVTRTATLRAGSLAGADCRAWIIPRERAVAIDEPFDLWLAEQLLKRTDP